MEGSPTFHTKTNTRCSRFTDGSKVFPGHHFGGPIISSIHPPLSRCNSSAYSGANTESSRTSDQLPNMEGDVGAAFTTRCPLTPTSAHRFTPNMLQETTHQMKQGPTT